MPQELLTLPPVYCVVGIYRLLTDPLIRQDKCRHGVRRGGLVGLFWAALTWKLQKAFVGYFLLSTPRFTGLSNDRVFGYQLPLDVGTCLLPSFSYLDLANFFSRRNLTLPGRPDHRNYQLFPFTESWDRARQGMGSNHD
ncbi:hypothetical protein AG1IA_08679 [Rhizoctonia solani AG-1 IA]|uniref:Uncharacterized protein n=1 Tax=Thanatephorus cucumeris (strain AG1-IA) TaxID=983506 RepID=L8WLU4_THACA|nr:hypothetical protein AG1IA_08679 [Rhizoctonia solani AG-1 IA]